MNRKRKAPPKRPSQQQCEALRDALLAAGAVGADRAMPRADVLARFRGSLGSTLPSADRCLRVIMSVAPEYGIPIVSSNHGYFVAVGPDDLSLCIADLSSRRGEISKRIDALDRLRDEIVPPPRTDGRLFD